MTVADTSLIAYRFVTAHGISADQQHRIVKTLVDAGEPLTRTELSDRSGIRVSSVCAAVNALVHLKEPAPLVELQRRKCRSTGYLAHPVTLADFVQPIAPLDVPPTAPPDESQLSLL